MFSLNGVSARACLCPSFSFPSPVYPHISLNKLFDASNDKIKPHNNHNNNSNSNNIGNILDFMLQWSFPR